MCLTVSQTATKRFLGSIPIKVYKTLSVTHSNQYGPSKFVTPYIGLEVKPGTLLQAKNSVDIERAKKFTYINGEGVHAWLTLEKAKMCCGSRDVVVECQVTLDKVIAINSSETQIAVTELKIPVKLREAIVCKGYRIK